MEKIFLKRSNTHDQNKKKVSTNKNRADNQSNNPQLYQEGPLRYGSGILFLHQFYEYKI